MSVGSRLHVVLSLRDRERLRRKIAENQREIGGELVIPGHPKGKAEGISERRMGRYSQYIDRHFGPDKNRLRQENARLSRVLANGSPDSLSKSKRIVLEKRIAEDREFLRRAMCPKTIYYSRYKDSTFDKAKQAVAREHTGEFQRVAQRYQNSMRQLDPNDPGAASVERLRPES